MPVKATELPGKTAKDFSLFLYFIIVYGTIICCVNNGTPAVPEYITASPVRQIITGSISWFQQVNDEFFLRALIIKNQKRIYILSYGVGNANPRNNKWLDSY